MKILFKFILLSNLLLTPSLLFGDEKPELQIKMEAEINAESSNPVDLVVDLERSGVHLDETEIERYRADIEKMSVEDTENISVEHKSKILASLVAFGHVQTLRDTIEGAMQRLKISSDSHKYEVVLTGSPMPNAAIYPGKSLMSINAGLIGFVSNVDELAGVIAHEMSHDNRDVFKADRDHEKVEQVLVEVAGYAGLKSSQREEIRADLAAVERMILAGYNPWAYFDFEKKLTKYMHSNMESGLSNRILKSLDVVNHEYLSTHPAGEIRMAAVKAYIAYRSRKIDISSLVGKHEKLSLGMQSLRLRMRLITEIISYSGYLLIGGSLSSAGYNFEYLKSIFQATASVVPKPNMDISSNPELVLMGAKGMLLLCGGTLLYLARQIYKMSSGHDELKDARRLMLRTISRLIKIKSESDVMFLSENILEIARDLETVFKGKSSVLKIFSPLNGLLYLKYSVNPLVRYNLKLLRLNYKNGKLTKMSYEYRVRSFFSGLPGFVFNSKKVIEEMSKVEFLTKELSDLSLSELKMEGRQNEAALKSILAIRGIDERNIDKNLKLLGSENFIEMASAIAKIGAVSWLKVAFAKFPRRSIRNIFSKENSNSELAYEITRIITSLKYDGRYMPKGLLYVYLYDMLFAGDYLSRRKSAFPERLVHYEVSNNVKISGTKMTNIRHALLRYSRALTRKYFSTQFETAFEISRFVNAEIIPIHISEESFSRDLFLAITSNPNLIKSERDILSVLRNEFYWPKLAPNMENSGGLEREMMGLIRSYAFNFPNVWKFEPSSSEVLHRLIYEKSKILIPNFEAYNIKKDIWTKMTDRGVSTVSDLIFHQIYEMADSDEKIKLEELALKEGRVLDFEVRNIIAKRSLLRNPDYKSLIESDSLTSWERSIIIESLVRKIKSDTGENINGANELLEFLSVQIKSNEEESLYIERAKLETINGEKSQDITLRMLSSILTQILDWKKSEQWDFLLFLRGDSPPSSRVTAGFNLIGTERIKRMFSLLPDVTKAQLLDSFLDAPRGLLNGRGNWKDKMVSHLLQNSTSEEAKVASEVLSAFLYALEKTGNGPLKSYVISYLYALPQSENASAGHTLKNILEIFGTTGVKLGQFIAASELLPPEDTTLLRGLNEKANIPTRNSIYEDISSTVENHRYRIGGLLGAASMKYAVLAEESGEQKVLKIFRDEAVHHTQMEFKLLLEMVNYLKGKFGRKYAVFGSVVNAAKAAVEKELSAQDEVRKSGIARERLYDKNQGDVKIFVPRDTYISEKLIEAEYARGVSFYELNSEEQRVFAEAIVRQETQNLFSDSNSIVSFDPDRHAGNYRVLVEEVNGGKNFTLSPIDFGQLIEIEVSDRDKIIELFSLSQILTNSGASEWGVDKVAELLGSDFDKAKLHRELKAQFPNLNNKPISAYYALLSSLENAGYRVPISYFDFLRAIIQINQYESFLPGNRNYKTASEVFEEAVQQRVEELKPSISMGFIEKARYFWNEVQVRPESDSMWRAVEAGFRKHILEVNDAPTPERADVMRPSRNGGASLRCSAILAH